MVFLPSWQAMDPDGKIVEGKGIAPDILVKTRPQDFRDGDPVIATAVKWLNSTKNKE